MSLFFSFPSEPDFEEAESLYPSPRLVSISSTKFVSFAWIFSQQLCHFVKVLHEKELEKEQESWEVGSSMTEGTVIE